jgi:hypothetical protein
MNKKYLYSILLVMVVALGFVAFNQTREVQKSDEVLIPDYKNAVYNIDGKDIKLNNGYSEEAIPQSTAKIITRYFGNDLITDLNNDGRDDIVFLITQETGGSGTFYYVVSAINTVNGYIGSDGYFLGDRIAPQTINNSQNPKHKNVVVVNYADRKEGEPMIAQPSVGKSAYLKLDENNRWGVVMADFEGESR